jgi:WhiB family transcriptional regulator, redox-sensing transcriptional regulator
MSGTVNSEVRDGVLSVGNYRSSAEELLDLLQGPAWRGDALCREYPDLAWFGQSHRRARAAAAVCAACLVRAECLSYAMADPGLNGIWGGLTAKERNQLRKSRTGALEGLTATG